MKQEVYYQFEVKKKESVFIINKQYSICSFSEILKEIMNENSESFVMIYSSPLPSSLEQIIDLKRKNMAIMRFINTRNPYTPNLKEIFGEISVFIGEITKEVENEFRLNLSQTQREYLNLLPKAIKNLILYSPILLELMKHKIEIEINSNLLQRREILYVFLMAMEKDNLSRIP